MSEFNKVDIVRKCCFSILPQVYWDRFTVTEQIAKIIDALNKLIENNSKLEDYIKEIIQEVIESGEIETIIKDILANYILNVKFPPNGITPASGDGSKDDTIAIQGCIDYAFNHNGMAVYFPSGKYLSSTLLLKNNVSLFGFDEKTTYIVLKGGATNPLLSGSATNNSFYGITFDGNADIQVNNINLAELSGSGYNFNNVTFTDGYNLLKLNLNGKVNMCNVTFGNAVISALITTGSGLINASQLTFLNLSTLSGKYAIDNQVSNAVFTGIYSTCHTETAIKNVSNNSVFVGKINNAVNTHSNLGTNNYYEFYDRGGTVSELINTEITERENSDNELQGYIDNEIIDRTNADTELQTSIDNEIMLRTNADAVITGLVNKRIAYYNTVADMKADVEIKDGDTIKTDGYYTRNDKGGSFYKIVNIDTGITVPLNNGLYAQLIHDDFIPVECVGAKSNDDSFDNAPIFNAVLNKLDTVSLKLNNGIYYVKSAIIMNLDTYYSKSICGTGSTGSFIGNSPNYTSGSLIEISCTGYSYSFNLINFGIRGSNNISGISVTSHGSPLTKSKIYNMSIIDCRVGLSINSSRMIDVSGCGFWSSSIGATGIDIKTDNGFSGDLFLSDCQFSNFLTGDTHHIYANAGNHNIAGLHFTHCTFYKATKYCFYARADKGMGDIWFDCCAFDDTTPTTIMFESSENDAVLANIIVSNCYFTAPRSPLIIYFPNNVNALVGCKFIGNYVNGNGGDSVLNINPACDFIVNNNNFHNSLGNTVFATVRLSQANGAICSNNSFYNTTPATAVAIDINGNSAITTSNIVSGYSGTGQIANNATNKLDNNLIV